MRRHLILALAAVTVTVIAACGSDAPDLTLAPTETNVVGSYNLTSAGGQLLPYLAFQTATESFSVSADKIILLGDNTWVDTTTYAVIELADGSLNAQQTSTSGIYQIADSQIKFVKTVGGNEAFTGSVTNNALTVVFNTQKYVYNR